MAKKKKKEFKFFWEEPIESVKKTVGEPFEFRFTFPKLANPKISAPEFKIGKQIPVSIGETDKQLIIRAEIPGFKKNEINLNVTENSIEISAVKKEEKIERTGRVFRQERKSGAIRRSFTLPSIVDPEKADAKLEDGLLTVVLPKIYQEKKKKKKLEIK
jgi:HSP20 family protein